MSDSYPLLFLRSHRAHSMPTMQSEWLGHGWRHHWHRPIPWQSHKAAHGETEGPLRQCGMFLERNSTWFLRAWGIMSSGFSPLSPSRMRKRISEVTFWAVAPKGWCPVEPHSGEFPDVCLYICLSIHQAFPPRLLRPQISLLKPQINAIRSKFRPPRPKFSPLRLRIRFHRLIISFVRH